MHHRRVVAKALSFTLVFALLAGSLFGSLANASPGTGVGVEPAPAAGQPAVQDAASAQFESLTPSESNVTIALPDGSHAITVDATYKDGSAKDVTTQGVWTSMDPAIAVVDRGVITAKAAGSTEVRLNLGDAVVNVPVTVTTGAAEDAPQQAEPAEPTLVTYLLSTLNVFVEADTNFPVHLHGTFSDGSTRDITADAVWSTDDSAIATVSHGMIKGVKAGESTFVRVKYGTMPTLSIAVTVQKEPIPFQLFGLLLSEDVLKLMETDAPHKMYADLEYPDQDRYEVTNLGKWYSGDEAVATVDANGVITPVGKGMTYIYFEYKYTAPTGKEGEDGYDDGLLVTSVQVFVGGPIKLERFTPDMQQQLDLDTPVTLPPRSFQEITIMGVYSEDPRTGQNYNADDVTGDVEWTVGDKSIATINDAGRIFAGAKEGTTTITGRYLAFEPFSFQVTVTKEAAASQVLNLVAEPTFVEITDGKPVRQPIIKAIYNDGTVEDVTSRIADDAWLASDPSVAYRGNDGSIVAESAGSAVVGAIYNDQIAIIPVIVKQAEPKTATSLTVTPGSLSLQIGKQEALSVEAEMADGERLDKTAAAAYRSANPQVVSVNRKGELTAVGKGTAAIEVAYGGQLRTITVEVAATAGMPAEQPETAPKRITGVTVSEPQVTLDVTGGPRAVTVQAAYEDGTSANVTAQGKWSTQDAGVATVKDGVLTPVAPGSTRVHLALDGAVVAVRVTVKDGDFSSNVRMADEGAAAEPTVDALLLSTTKVLVEKGATYPVQLLAVKSDGTTEDVSDQAQWSVYDTDIADVVKDNGAVGILGKSTGTANPDQGYQKFGRTTLTVAYGDFTPTIVNVSVSEKPGEPDVLDIGFRTSEYNWYFEGSSFRLYKGQAPYELKPFALDTTGETFSADGGQWTFSQPGIVAVNDASGFEALATGETDAVFTYEQFGVTYSRTLHFEVVDLQGIQSDADQEDGVYRVDVHPQGSSLVGLNETVTDQDGQSHVGPLSGFVDWQIEDPELVAVYDEQPYVRFVAGTKEGTTRVTGTYFGHTIAFDVTVTKNPIKPKIMTIVTDPTHYVFDDAADQPVAPVVKAIYSDATVQTLDNADLTWFSGDPTIADLTEDGKIMRTNRKGGTNVVGQYKGIPVNVPVIATYSDATPVATGLTVTPDLNAMTVGGTQPLKATATMSDLSEVDVTDLAMFESKNPDVATVGTDGVVTAVKAGTAKLRVYYWGFNEYLTVTVSPASSGGGPGTIITPPAPPATDDPDQDATPETPVLHDAVDGASVKDRIGKALADATPVAFSDVPAASWSASAIALAAKAGFVEGYADGSFAPKKNVTRAEFAAMLAKALGLGEAAPESFTDVKADHWAHGAIGALKALGFINGYGDGSFRPNQPITRAEMIAILARVIDFGKAAGDSPFTDVNGHWAEPAIAALTEAGVVKGKAEHAFAPNANATREESVALILRALDACLNLGLEL
ncbi:S-layer homology domain-containing protein [Paenibacillus sp. MWE-103]|uniref:S-layer homology domain-containing protein n=1 Tax=Paenibacillus artemisiicola TaxID=1172618 RepID=A0ABS3WJE0_9BACL|nr:S-layer homology domain-containing protein [Paenibacillus artemisiicola]MBO7748444.1 S-layer homology domain-containing protein [Paenibacillus artemisiicola]